MSELRQYSCDLGSWESGFVVPFMSENDETAIEDASEIAESKGENLHQVRRGLPLETGRKLIYDDFNGNLSRE